MQKGEGAGLDRSCCSHKEAREFLSRELAFARNRAERAGIETDLRVVG